MLWLILFLIINIYAEQKPQIKSLSDFSGGLNTKFASAIIPENQTPDCQNVLFDEIGGVTRRKGYKYKGYPSTTTIGNKLWYYKKSTGEEFYITQIQDKLYYSPDMEDGTWSLITSGLKWELNSLQATVVNDKIFFTNGIDTVFSFDGTNISEYDFIPKGKYIASISDASSGIIYDRVFIANTYDYPSGVYWTDTAYLPSQENAWNETQLFFVGQNNGDIITGLYVWKGDLYIFKRNSIWRLSGASPEAGYLIKLTSEYGCISQDTIDEYKNGLIFLSDKGVIFFDGSFFREISLPIEPDIDNTKNISGQVNYWINTTNSDFSAGTSTSAITISGNEIKLKDKSKKYENFTLSMGTYTNVIINNAKNLSLDFTFNPSGLYNLEFNPLSILAEYSADFDVYKYNLLNLDDDDYNSFGYFTISSIPTFYFKRKREYHGGYVHKDYHGTTPTSSNILIKNIKFDKSIISYLRIKGGIDTWKENYTQDGNDLWVKSGGLKYKISVLYKTEWLDDPYDEIYSEEGIFSFSAKHGWGSGNKITDNQDFDIILSTNVSTFDPPPTDEFQIKIDFWWDVNWGTGYEWTDGEKEVKLQLMIERIRINEIEIKEDVSAGFTTYSSTGTFQTNTYDFGEQVAFSTFTVTDFAVTGTTIYYKIKSSTDNINWSSWYDISDNQKISCPDGRYVQVISSFSTSISSYTPRLQDFTIGAIKSTGTWISAKFNANKVGAWKYFITEDVKNNQTINYFVRFATSSTALDNASWNSVSSGDLLTSIGGTNKWMQAKVGFSTTDGIQNPACRSITLTWYPETDFVNPVGRVNNRRYWLAVSTAYNYNHLVYILDKNMAWTKFDGYYINDMLEVGTNIYILDALKGAIWQAEQGNVDRYENPSSSQTINAYWQSKDLFFAIDRESELEYIYPTFKKTGGNIILGYSTDYDTTFTTKSVSLSGTGIQNDRIPIQWGEISKIWKFEIKQNNNEDPFELYNINIYYKPKSLR